MANPLQYEVSKDFPSGKVEPWRFAEEIKAAGLSVTLQSVDTVADAISLKFDQDVPKSDQDIVDGGVVDSPKGGLIAAHDNSANPSPVEKKTADPTASDDARKGYQAGYRWINANSGVEWVCFDSTVWAAIWRPTTSEAIYEWAANNSYSPGTTVYTMHFGTASTESQRQFRLGTGRKLRRIRVNVTTNTLTIAATLKIRKNGADSGIALTISAGQTGQLEATGNVSFVGSDLVSVQTSIPAGTGTLEFRGGTIGWEP